MAAAGAAILSTVNQTKLDKTPRIYSVRALVGEIRQLLEASYRQVWIEGEITGLAKPSSGHLYFSLKEDNAVVRCAFFRNRRSRSATPEEGMQVLVKGQISVYEQRGDLQLIVSHLEPAGEGALRRAFELLKAKLEEQGLFEPDRKQDLPEYPQTIGIITSSTGAALHDIRVTLKRRYPQSNIILYPALVQGEQATQQVCEMLSIANDRREVDVLIVARGGGSLEDLQAFNEESVARAISNSAIPVVTGIGHETDITISDLVADRRAATPTAAAELVSPLAEEMRRNCLNLTLLIQRYAERQINQHWQQVDYASARLIHPTQKLERYRFQQQTFHARLLNYINHMMSQLQFERKNLVTKLHHNSPEEKLIRCRDSVDDLFRRTLRQINFDLSKKNMTVQQLDSSLQLISPLSTLERGYAILQDAQGDVVTSPVNLSTGDPLNATVSGGKFKVKVT